MKEIECPYCGLDNDPPEEAYTEDQRYETSCFHCEKNFFVIPYYIRGYREEKAPCLNGVPHELRELDSQESKYIFKRCKNCDHIEYILKESN